MAEKKYLEKSRALEILHDTGDIDGLTELDTCYAAGFDDAINAAYNKILYEPTISHMHGHWIQKQDNKCECSECGLLFLIGIYPHGNINYCPNCGAKMDGGGTNGEDH